MSELISKEEYDSFREFLEKASGIVLGDSKHYLVSSRLSRLMVQHELKTFADLMGSLRTNRQPELRDKIVDAMTTNETMWFRDTFPYETLKNHILPEFAQKKSGPLRIWSAACSTGQEPYSLSMIVSEFISANPGKLNQSVQIVATDISPTVLAGAKSGLYDESAMSRGISDDRKRRFFTKKGDEWEVNADIKSRIQFKNLNLQQSYSLLGRFDMVFCRNVLIYFSADLKKDILERMASTLNPQGYLMLGSSETPSRYTDVYAMLRVGNGVMYQKK